MAHRVGSQSPSQPTESPDSDSASRESIDDDGSLNTPPDLDLALRESIDDDDTLNTPPDSDLASRESIGDDGTLNTPPDSDPARESVDRDDTLNNTAEEDVDLEDPSPSPPPPLAQCCLCLDDFSQPTMNFCAGTQNWHHICTECYRIYLETELAFGGSYEGTRLMGGNSTLVSRPGELPCPFFLDTADPCDCVALPVEGIRQILLDNPQIQELFYQASSRVSDGQKVPPKSQSENINSPPPSTVQDVYRIVSNVLTKASMMRCPSCGFPGLKDEACMHIRCENPNCATQWCYCCGRHRRRSDNSEDCRGCDSSSPHLQYNQGWGCYKGDNDHPGTGARNEFHRRISRYYIQRVRHETSPELWEAFRRAYPNILTNVPVRGCSISWEELDSPDAMIPPLFGRSTEADLLWRLPPLAGDAESGGGGDSQRTANNRTNHVTPQPQPQPPPPPQPLPPINFQFISEQVFHSRRHGLSWLFIFASTSVLILLNRVVLDEVSLGLKAVTTLMVAFLVYGVVAFGLLLLADLSALRTWRGEQQFFVSHEDDELPFLSENGRWSSHRDTYVRFFVGGVALGSWMVGCSDNMPSLRGIGSTMLTFVITIFCWLSFLVNRSRPLPYGEDGRIKKRLFLTLAFWSILWAVSIGFHVSGRKDDVVHNVVGSVMLTLGLAGLAAEMMPRIFWGDGVFPFVTSYVSCFSLAVGSALIKMGISYDSLDLRYTGGYLLGLGLFYSFSYWMIGHGMSIANYLYPL